MAVARHPVARIAPPAPAIISASRARVGERNGTRGKRAFRSSKETDEGKNAPPYPNFLRKNPPYKQCMGVHSSLTASVFVCYPSLKKARSAPAHCVHGSVARPVDGSSLCNRITLALRCCCPRKPDARLLDESRVGLRQNSCPRRCERELDQLHVERPSKIGIRRFDYIIIKSLHNPIADA